MLRLLAVLGCVWVALVLGSSIEEIITPEFSNITSSEVENNPAPSECLTEKKTFVVDTTQKVGWIRNYRDCRSNGMEMVIIGNKEEYDLLVNTIKEKLLPSEDEGVWTSGYYDRASARYQWMTRLTPMTYSIWRPGRPEEAPSWSRCVELRRKHNYTMDDVTCVIQKNYGACQKITKGVKGADC